MRLSTRRSVLAGLAALAAATGARDFGRGRSLDAANDRLAAIESRAGGRLGVAVIEAGRGLGSRIGPTSAFRCAAPSSFSPPPRC